MNLTVLAGILLAVTLATARKGEKSMQAAGEADEPEEATREAARPASLVEKKMNKRMKQEAVRVEATGKTGGLVEKIMRDAGEADEPGKAKRAKRDGIRSVNVVDCEDPRLQQHYCYNNGKCHQYKSKDTGVLFGDVWCVCPVGFTGKRCLDTNCLATAGLPPAVMTELKTAEKLLKCEISCLSVDGQNWVVFQRNILKYSAPFAKAKWANYAEGFSTIDADGNGVLWLGLKRLASLSKGNKLQLMIKVTWAESQDNVEANSVSWAIWRDFGVGDADGYPLRVGPMIGYSANLPSHPGRKPGISLDGEKFDPLAFHRNMNFSTPDRDNDQESSFSCAEQYASGWWYNRCAYVNLNRDPPAWFDGKNVHFAKETKMAFRLDN